MLYTTDPYSGEHLVIDGDTVFRLRTRAEALAIANRRHEAACAKREAEQQAAVDDVDDVDPDT